AIIQLAGKQFLVKKGDTLTVDRLEAPVDGEITVTDVLVVGSGDKSKIGTPLVEKASVTLKVAGHGKGEKIRVAKYKSKSRYRKVYGHRQHQTTLQVLSIAS